MMLLFVVIAVVVGGLGALMGVYALWAVGRLVLELQRLEGELQKAREAIRALPVPEEMAKVYQELAKRVADSNKVVFRQLLEQQLLDLLTILPSNKIMHS